MIATIRTARTTKPTPPPTNNTYKVFKSEGLFRSIFSPVFHAIVHIWDIFENGPKFSEKNPASSTPSSSSPMESPSP